MKPDCTCGHSFDQHTQTLFGCRCLGREWHDSGSSECSCISYSEGKIVAPIAGVPW